MACKDVIDIIDIDLNDLRLDPNSEDEKSERTMSRTIDKVLEADHRINIRNRRMTNSDSAAMRVSVCVMNCFPSRAKRYIRRSIESLCNSRRAWTTDDMEEYSFRERKVSLMTGERLSEVAQVSRNSKLSLML